MDEDPRPWVVKSPLAFNAPCSDERAELLVREACGEGTRVLDLGCGWGELLVRLCNRWPDTHGTGVDAYEPYLDRARTRTQALGLETRVGFVAQDISAWDESADLVIAVGASHAWAEAAADRVAALRHLVAPRGRLLLGEAIWARTPPPDVLEALGTLPTETDFLRAAIDDFRVLSLQRSSLEEWDAFEAGWRAPFEASGIAGLETFAHERKQLYELGYRGVMGFVWLLLERPD